MENIIVKRRMHIPGLHHFHHIIAKFFSLEHHEIIAVAVPGEPCPVIHRQPGRLVGRIIGIKLILMEAALARSKIEQNKKLQNQEYKEHDPYDYFFLFFR